MNFDFTYFRDNSFYSPLSGEEVSDFGVCSGKFVGAVKQLAVKDVSSGKVQVSLVPKSGSKHDWVFVKTVSGQETCTVGGRA